MCGLDPFKTRIYFHIKVVVPKHLRFYHILSTIVDFTRSKNNGPPFYSSIVEVHVGWGEALARSVFESAVLFHTD